MSTCYAVPEPTFQPAMRLISAITQAVNAQVTTTFDHNYRTGLIVRFYIPRPDGMTQLDGKVGTITVVDDTNFTVDIDTRAFDPFAIPGSPGAHDFTCAQVIPIGEVNSTLDQATRNVLPYS